MRLMLQMLRGVTRRDIILLYIQAISAARHSAFSHALAANFVRRYHSFPLLSGSALPAMAPSAMRAMPIPRRDNVLLHTQTLRKARDGAFSYTLGAYTAQRY